MYDIYFFSYTKTISFLKNKIAEECWRKYGCWKYKNFKQKLNSP